MLRLHDLIAMVRIARTAAQVILLVRKERRRKEEVMKKIWKERLIHMSKSLDLLACFLLEC